MTELGAETGIDSKAAGGNSTAAARKFCSVLDAESIVLTSDMDGNFTGDCGGMLFANLPVLGRTMLFYFSFTIRNFNRFAVFFVLIPVIECIIHVFVFAMFILMFLGLVMFGFVTHSVWNLPANLLWSFVAPRNFNIGAMLFWNRKLESTTS